MAKTRFSHWILQLWSISTTRGSIEKSPPLSPFGRWSRCSPSEPQSTYLPIPNAAQEEKPDVRKRERGTKSSAEGGRKPLLVREGWSLARVGFAERMGSSLPLSDNGQMCRREGEGAFVLNVTPLPPPTRVGLWPRVGGWALPRGKWREERKRKKGVSPTGQIVVRK